MTPNSIQNSHPQTKRIHLEYVYIFVTFLAIFALVSVIWYENTRLYWEFEKALSVEIFVLLGCMAGLVVVLVWELITKCANFLSISVMMFFCFGGGVFATSWIPIPLALFCSWALLLLLLSLELGMVLATSIALFLPSYRDTVSSRRRYRHAMNLALLMCFCVAQYFGVRFSNYRYVRTFTYANEFYFLSSGFSNGGFDSSFGDWLHKCSDDQHNCQVLFAIDKTLKPVVYEQAPQDLCLEYNDDYRRQFSYVCISQDGCFYQPDEGHFYTLQMHLPDCPS